LLLSYDKADFTHGLMDARIGVDYLAAVSVGSCRYGIMRFDRKFKRGIRSVLSSVKNPMGSITNVF